MPENPEGKGAEASPAPAATPAANAASAPDAKAAEKEVNKSRRTIIWACIWGYLGVNFLMFLRFFFPRALYEPNTIFNIGYPADFGLGIDQRYLDDQPRLGGARTGPPLRDFRAVHASRLHAGMEAGREQIQVPVPRQRLRQRRRQFRRPGAAPDGSRLRPARSHEPASLWTPAVCS